MHRRVLVTGLAGGAIGWMLAAGASDAGASEASETRTGAEAAGGGAPAKASVEATERRFAETMAKRDHAAFTAFLAADAVFFSSDTGGTVLRGRDEVSRAWKPYFEKPAAPFSWEPDLVEALSSGQLALSSGPVRSPAGTVVGRFTSIWRLEPDGAWRIVFDKGSPVCAATPRPAGE